MADFDLIANPDLIRPAYGFYAVFAGASAVLASITVLAIRLNWQLRTSLRIFTPLWITLVCTLAYLDARDVQRVKEMVRRGEYSTVEGCVRSFQPGSPTGSRTTAGDESWIVADREFAYGQGQAMPYYHTVESKGGLIHANSKVRVSFVISPYDGGAKIVRLQVLQPDCRTAH